MSTYVILHNIRSAHNVGSIFRTADGAGVAKLFLVGYTPHPIDRFGRIQEEIRKTSLGATESIPWEVYESIEPLLLRLQNEGCSVVAVEQHARAVPYCLYKQGGDTAYVFGNEVEGVPDEVCIAADAVIEIPMAGMKESLNVSVAAGVILFGVRALH
jgi:23S rRNA (guanosine2251-2'-O)-methyltransferase